MGKRHPAVPHLIKRLRVQLEVLFDQVLRDVIGGLPRAGVVTLPLDLVLPRPALVLVACKANRLADLFVVSITQVRRDGLKRLERAIGLRA